MIRLELTPEEAALLREIIADDLSDLRMEITDTDSMDYRTELRLREALFNRLLQQLEAPRAA